MKKVFWIVWVVLFLAYGNAVGADVKKEKIQVRVSEEDPHRFRAGISSLKSKAKLRGMDQMQLVGRVETKELPGGRKRVSVYWEEARLKEASVKMDDVFVSYVVVKKDTTLKGKKFAAEGNMDALIRAWESLQMPSHPTLTPLNSSQSQRSSAPASSRVGGGGVSAGGDSARGNIKHPSMPEKISPEGKVKEKSSPPAKLPQVSSTREGCSIRVDKEQMVAIVQERAVIDGSPQAECHDTMTRLPIKKEYRDCEVEVMDNEVYPRYRLIYSAPDSKDKIEVERCMRDTDHPIAIRETEEGCEKIQEGESSISLARRVYDYRGEVIEVSGVCAF